eukprot:30531_1
MSQPIQQPQLTYQYLFSLCPYELIRGYIVKDSEVQGYWHKQELHKQYQKHWKPTWVFNVICQHQDCINNKGWYHRRNFKNFKKYWNKNHTTEEDKKNCKFKIVSFWDTDTSAEGTKCTNEYRLVDQTSLDYINPAVSIVSQTINSDNNININIETTTNIEHENEFDSDLQHVNNSSEQTVNNSSEQRNMEHVNKNGNKN